MNMNDSTDIENRIRTVVINTLEISNDQYSEELTAGDIPEWDSLGHLGGSLSSQGFPMIAQSLISASFGIHFGTIL